MNFYKLRLFLIILIKVMAGILFVMKTSKQTLSPKNEMLQGKATLKNAPSKDQKPVAKDYAPGEVLLKFKPDTPKSVIEGFKKSLGVTSETYIQSIQVYHWKGKFEVKEAIRTLTQSKYVQYAEPNYRVQTQK